MGGSPKVGYNESSATERGVEKYRKLGDSGRKENEEPET